MQWLKGFSSCSFVIVVEENMKCVHECVYMNYFGHCFLFVAGRRKELFYMLIAFLQFNCDFRSVPRFQTKAQKVSHMPRGLFDVCLCARMF